MAGWKDFVSEWRKRDAFYATTPGHVAMYADSTDTLYTVSGSGEPANHHMGNLEVTRGASSWRGVVYSEAWGKDALKDNTTGEFNTAVGYWSMYTNTTGSSNTAVGFFTLYNNISGTNNVAIGRAALSNNTTGSYNTAVGSDAGLSMETGSLNIAIGSGSLYRNKIGDFNTAIGVDSLSNNISGSNNVCLGNNAGLNELGSNKLYIDSTSSTVGTSADALIYGDFIEKFLRIDADVEVTGTLKSEDNFVITRVPVPSTSSSPGKVGQVAINTTHFYICIGVDSWRRVSLSTF